MRLQPSSRTCVLHNFCGQNCAQAHKPIPKPLISKQKAQALVFWAATCPHGWPAIRGIFHTICGKRCEQAHHSHTNSLISLSIHNHAQFLGIRHLCTAAMRQHADIPAVRSLGYSRVPVLPVFFTNFVEKIVSNPLDRGQSP